MLLQYTCSLLVVIPVSISSVHRRASRDRSTVSDCCGMVLCICAIFWRLRSLLLRPFALSVQLVCFCHPSLVYRAHVLLPCQSRVPPKLGVFMLLRCAAECIEAARPTPLLFSAQTWQVYCTRTCHSLCLCFAYLCRVLCGCRAVLPVQGLFLLCPSHVVLTC